MYVDRIRHEKPNGKVYVHYFLRTSRREGKKTIKKTILNITPWGEETCEAIAVALRHQHDIKDIVARFEAGKISGGAATPSVEQGKSIGSVWLLAQLAQRLGVTEALGDTREGRLALWQILARTLDQGSRLSASRLGRHHEIGFLNLGRFDEDTLYVNLDWISENQTRIENALYKRRHGDGPCKLFLYDVTSSYFEGVMNELADYGCNRDKKRGKLQIVVGLLCDDGGTPVSVEVFEGNTNDVKTFHNQVRKVADRFLVKEVVFVGDRGMIKTAQQKELTEQGFGFITALTTSQVKTLIGKGVIQMEFFDENVSEIVLKDGKRHVLRRNPVRADEIAASRKSKLASLHEYTAKKNEYLREHKMARFEIATKHVEARAKKLKIDGWVEVASDTASRGITVRIDDEKLKEASVLDGCYCLTTSVGVTEMDKDEIHAKYKDLAMVENAFRTCKTGRLELRPIYVRKAGRTRAHVFVVMLSYLLVLGLRDAWCRFDVTVEEGLELLSTLCTVKINLHGGTELHQIPSMRKDLSELYRATEVPRPEILPGGKTIADSQKMLPSRRNLRQ